MGNNQAKYNVSTGHGVECAFELRCTDSAFLRLLSFRGEKTRMIRTANHHQKCSCDYLDDNYRYGRPRNSITHEPLLCDNCTKVYISRHQDNPPIYTIYDRVVQLVFDHAPNRISTNDSDLIRHLRDKFSPFMDEVVVLSHLNRIDREVAALKYRCQERLVDLGLDSTANWFTRTTCNSRLEKTGWSMLFIPGIQQLTSKYIDELGNCGIICVQVDNEIDMAAPIIVEKMTSFYKFTADGVTWTVY